MPNEDRFTAIREAVGALLTLSDAVHERAGLKEAIVGRETPVKMIPDEVAREVPRLEQCLRFSDSDLSAIHLSRSSLAPFTTPSGASMAEADLSWGHSTIERLPLIDTGDAVVLLLPTAVSRAITRFVVEQVETLGLSAPFERTFCREV